MSQSRTYEHFVYTKPEQSDELAGAYQQAGYSVEVIEYDPDEDEWGDLVMVYANYTEEDRAKVQQIAADHGARYDGGGMYVGPLAELGGAENA